MKAWNLRERFHRIHMQASVFDEFNPISYLFSLLNIKSKSHSQSQKSSFSLLLISSLSSLKSQPFTDFTPYRPQSKPWLLPPPLNHHTHSFASLSTMGLGFSCWWISFLVSRLLGIFSSFFMYLFLYLGIWFFPL